MNHSRFSLSLSRCLIFSLSATISHPLLFLTPVTLALKANYAASSLEMRNWFQSLCKLRCIFMQICSAATLFTLQSLFDSRVSKELRDLNIELLIIKWCLKCSLLNPDHYRPETEVYRLPHRHLRFSSSGCRHHSPRPGGQVSETNPS